MVVYRSLTRDIVLSFYIKIVKLLYEKSVLLYCLCFFVKFVIIIQDVIMNLTAEADAIATVFTEDTKVSWNISQGILIHM